MKKLISIMTDSGLVEQVFDDRGYGDPGLVVKAVHDLIMARLGLDVKIESIIIKPLEETSNASRI